MRISDWSSDVCSSDLSGWVIFTSVPSTSTVIESLMRPRIASDGGGLGPRWAHLTGPPPRHPPMAPSLRDIPGANQPRKRFASNRDVFRSEEHTSELQSLMRISYAVFCLKKKKQKT